MSVPVRQRSLYEPASIAALFDEMAATYGAVNLIASFGFAARWRRQCVEALDVAPGSTVVDLMCGMGELTMLLAPRVGPAGRVVGIDISAEMCRRAERVASKYARGLAEVRREDALDTSIEAESVDALACSFGLKTLSPTQIRQLAREVHRVLRPGGQLAFVEISRPAAAWLRLPYFAYISWAIPLIGLALMGNPRCYRKLGEYTRGFGSCAEACDQFADEGLEVRPFSLFGGCATGFAGRKM